MLENLPIPLGVGGIAAAVGLSLGSPPAAMVAGLGGYAGAKIIQSTIWTLFGDPRV